jgi:lysophospholipase L1-like esterase
MNLKYITGAVLALPLLPIMYYQGKKIKASIPDLPEAEGVSGKAICQSNKQLKIITIGESTIAGVGVKTHQEGFTGNLAKELSSKLNANIDWNVYAKSGFNAKAVREQILPNIQQEAVDLIVIGLGGNDTFELNSPRKWRQHINALISELKVKFSNCPIVFTGLPPVRYFPAFTPLLRFVFGNLSELLNQEIKSLITKQEDIFYHEAFFREKIWEERAQLALPIDAYFSDGVHPSKLTYEIWAENMSEFIVKHDLVRIK